MHKKASPLKHVALVSAPWPLYNRPSIQLGTLKAYLAAHFPGLKISAFHWYLELAAQLGYPVYSALSQRMWLAESVYAALLYPEHSPGIQRLFQRLAADRKILPEITFSSLVQTARQATHTFIDCIDWHLLGLAGFSISLNQLTASLYLIRCIKQKHPTVPIVVGGASLAGEAARGLLQVFPEIDGAVVGEGEAPLSAMVAQLIHGCRFEALTPIKGLIMRRDRTATSGNQPSQVADLNNLPLPDFRDYFECLNDLPAHRRFFPMLCAEMSRGCWWRNPSNRDSGKGCAFCNLNRQWRGYRAKKPEKIISEIDELTTRHQTLRVAFMDNVLPPQAAKKVFKQIPRLQKDLDLFAEIRTGVSWDTLHAMHAAGVTELQIGIEALSSRLIDKLNKGASCMDNVEIMKHCEELGIANVSNLITHFPGSDADDVAETLQVLEFVQPFRPLKTVRFWLGLGSPVADNPGDYGIKAVFNHPNYGILFPRGIARRVRFMVQAYHGDLTRQHRLWRPVIKKVGAWQRSYARWCGSYGSKPLLSYQDGRDFLMISQRHGEGHLETHRLSGASRRIYLFCRQQRSLGDICRAFSSFNEATIINFLSEMHTKKLMFSEKDRFLSLAIGRRPR